MEWLPFVDVESLKIYNFQNILNRGYTFYGCESLENINIPERVKVIEDGTF